MKKNLKIVALTGLTSLIAVMPMVAFTQVNPAEGPIDVAPGEAFSYIIATLRTLTNWMLVLLIVVAAAVIVYAGYLYLTAGGDSEKVGKANKVILFAIVAIGVGILARVIVALAQALAGRGR